MESLKTNKKDYEKTTWRLIKHQPAYGAWNMAVDEAILESVYSGDSLPTLRLYAWQPGCLSLGYAQSFSEVDTDALKTYGWDVVRRPTGGRAILHIDELTYSVIAPEREPRVKGGVMESYLQLSRALMRSLQLLGLEPQAKEKETTKHKDKPNPVCFEVPSNYEITVNGKKLVGSAQARRKEGVLQHGALPLFGDLTRIITALRFPDQAVQESAKDRLLSHATTVEIVLGKVITWDQASEAFQQGFEETLNLILEENDITEKERLRAQELIEEKYNHPSWTQRI